MNRMPTEISPARPTICVFCGSSHGADPAYTEAARRFGTLMVAHGFDLVFGGGGVGLMGEVALSVSKAGGNILGIIPTFLRYVEPPLKVASKIVVTDSMNERKARMFASADNFAVLPGGFDPLLALIDHFVAQGFAGAPVTELIQIVPTVEDAMKVFAARHKARPKQPA